MPAQKGPHATKDERMLVAASGFTGLWALTWLTSTAMGAGDAAVQGGFALGGVVATGELAALWWKTRAIKSYQEANGEDDGEGGEKPAHADEPAA